MRIIPGTLGCTIDAPVAAAYAVLPVAVDITSPVEERMKLLTVGLRKYTLGTKVWKRFDIEARSGNGFGAKQNSTPCFYASYLSYVN